MVPDMTGGRGRHRGRGTRRGDVRAAVLALLAERPMHGYELIQQIEERSGGRWRPSPGSVYPTLQMLADEGLVTGDESGGRRLFTLTEAGTAQAQRHAADAPWTQRGSDPEWEAVRQVMEELGQLGMAVRQVVSVGTDEQRAEILGAVADVRRRAYRLLAESPDVPVRSVPDDTEDTEDTEDEDVPPVPPAP
jgi:DNA-binding PadR family transcriptional regulator